MRQRARALRPHDALTNLAMVDVVPNPPRRLQIRQHLNRQHVAGNDDADLDGYAVFADVLPAEERRRGDDGASVVGLRHRRLKRASGYPRAI